MSDLRNILHSAYTFVRSIEENKSIASITLDHVINDRISRLKAGESQTIVDSQGNNLGERASRYDQLTDLENQLDNVVKAIQDAGNDPDKLALLGITEADDPTVDEGT